MMTDPLQTRIDSIALQIDGLASRSARDLDLSPIFTALDRLQAWGGDDKDEDPVVEEATPSRSG